MKIVITKKQLYTRAAILLIAVFLLILIDGFRSPERQIVTRGMEMGISLYQRYISGVFFANAKICRYTPT